MKIAGKPLGKKASKTVTLTRGEEVHEFLLTALPLGFVEVVLDDRLPMPVPPRNYVKDANGALMKDRDGFPALEQVFDTLPMRKARTRAIHLRGVAMVVEGLSADKSVTWDAKPGADWEAYYSALSEEMVASGLTAGEMAFLLNETRALSEKKQKDVEAARDGFLSVEEAARKGAAGASRPTPQAASSST